jgi:hypothetical protein
MLRLFLIVFLLSVAPAVRAQNAIFSTQEGAAINGYDTVAYFVMGKAMPGEPGISVMWKGAVWHFISESHREAFEANPRAYAPQYGGYCAYGLSKGHRATGNPESWSIQDGRLYLAHSDTVLRIWQSDIPAYMQASEANWPAILFD